MPSGRDRTAAGRSILAASASKTRPLRRTEWPPAPSGSQYRSTPKSRASSTCPSFLGRCPRESAPTPTTLAANYRACAHGPPRERRGYGRWAPNPGAWRPPRKRSTRRTISSSPGRRRRCPSASGRSTSTACTRTSASSSRSSSRRCSTGTFRPGGRVLDPFAGSGTTLVQALESGYDATGVDIAGFNALLARVKTRPYNLEALRRDLLWAHAEAEAFEPRGRYPRGRLGVRARLVRAGGGRGAAPLPLARRAGRLGRRAPRRARALGALGPADGPFRPRVPPRAPARAVLVLQAPARVQAGRVGAAVPPPLHARHARADRGVRGRRGPTGYVARVLHGDARDDRPRRAVRRRHHLAALSRA